jgi:hypothetical protein
VILSKLQHSPTGSSREGVKGESFTEKPLDAANSVVKLPGETMCAMKFDAVAVVGNVNL